MLERVLFQDPQAAPSTAPSTTGAGEATQSTSLEPTADGAEGQTPSANPFTSLMPFLLIGVIFWVLIIGPERKNRKKREQMIRALQKDDKVLTTSGIYGRVAKVEDEVVTVVVADGVRMRFSRASIQGVLDDGKEKDGAKVSGKDSSKENDKGPGKNADDDAA